MLSPDELEAIRRSVVSDPIADDPSYWDWEPRDLHPWCYRRDTQIRQLLAHIAEQDKELVGLRPVVTAARDVNEIVWRYQPTDEAVLATANELQSALVALRRAVEEAKDA